jgi:hypothetical protein
MNARSLGATRVFAWPRAEVAVMGAVAAVRVLHRRKLAEVDPELRPQVEAELAAEHEKLAGGIDRAREIGVVDEVVDPTHTRTALATALAKAEAGTAAKLASALRGWQKLRFEVTEEPSNGVEGERYSFTPELGVFHATTGVHGDIMVPEERLKAAMLKAAAGEADLTEEVERLLGRPWDDELEPFRYAGDGAPVRWLHQVV